MTEKDWSRLKSGTDIRGVAVKTKNEDIELTDDVIKRICYAFAQWYCKKSEAANLCVAVGHDCRISSPRIKKAAIDGFLSYGCKVFDCGLASTPSMFMCIAKKEEVNASLEITASHHPYQRNGLKFFTKDGGLESDDITDILQFAAADQFSENHNNKFESLDFMSEYCEILKKKIIDESNCGEFPLDGLHIVVDAGNGVGGFFAKDILEPLGADITGSRFLEPNGMFPNHIPNPENNEAIKSACDMVKSSGAHLGFIFDTDVDRMGCISSSGKEINRNCLVALASVIALENCDGGTIVTDSLTSDGLRAFIENDLHGKQLRYKRGYKNVINKCIELNENGIESPLAIETSGHAALKENYYLDDGAYLATKIIIKLAQLKKNEGIDSLISNLKEPAESLEVRIPILLNDFKNYGENVIESINEYANSRKDWQVEEDNYEGVRINIKGGWLLLRLSVHDPILPLNIENEKHGVCASVLAELKEYLSKFDKLDLSDFD